MAKTTAGHAVADVLCEMGVRNVMGIVGSCMIEILDGMYDREDIHFLSVRHEQAAAVMADGFGRMSGFPGVCMATNGPGATNLITGVANAMDSQSPMVVITGAPKMSDMYRDSFQELDQLTMYAPIVKWQAQPRTPDRVADTLREAFEVSVSGVPGPVQVDLARDVMNEDTEPPRVDGAVMRNRPRAAPDPAAVRAAAELLKGAERPVIIAGGGVAWSNADAGLVALSDLLDAPIVTAAFREDAAPRSHPLFLGSVGRDPLPDLADVVREADVVLALGTRLAQATSAYKRDFFAPDVKLIHAAVDPRTIGRYYRVSVGLLSDTGLAIEALIGAVGEKQSRPAMRKRAEAIRAAQDRRLEEFGRLDAKPIDPRKAHAVLAKLLPEDTVIATDGGSVSAYSYYLHKFERPRSFFATGDLASIGLSFPLGLGLKLAAPERTVVTINGDGCFLCNGSELETAVRENLNTVTFILNNFNYGSERAYQKHFYEGRYIGDVIGNPAFDEYARAFGAAGFKVTDSADMEDTFAEALKAGREQPVLVDVICDSDIFPEPRRKDTIRADRLKS